VVADIERKAVLSDVEAVETNVGGALNDAVRTVSLSLFFDVPKTSAGLRDTADVFDSSAFVSPVLDVVGPKSKRFDFSSSNDVVDDNNVGADKSDSPFLSVVVSVVDRFLFAFFCDISMI
jgi:hypothetical protein